MKFRTMPAMWHAKNIHISYNCRASFFQRNSFHRKWNGISHSEDMLIAMFLTSVGLFLTNSGFV